MFIILLLLIVAAVVFFALHASHDKRLNKLEADGADVLHEAASMAGDQIRNLRNEFDQKLASAKASPVMATPEPAPVVVAAAATLTAKNL